MLSAQTQSDSQKRRSDVESSTSPKKSAKTCKSGARDKERSSPNSNSTGGGFFSRLFSFGRKSSATSEENPSGKSTSSSCEKATRNSPPTAAPRAFTVQQNAEFFRPLQEQEQKLQQHQELEQRTSITAARERVGTQPAVPTDAPNTTSTCDSHIATSVNSIQSDTTAMPAISAGASLLDTVFDSQVT